MGRTRGRKKLSGAKRMRELGYKKVDVWLDPSEFQAIKNAHPSEKLATLLRRLACEDAGKQFIAR
jgi:hypothetical protein